MEVSQLPSVDKPTGLERYAPTLLFITIFGFLFTDLATEQIFGTIARCPNLFTAPIIFLIIQFHTKKIQPVKLASFMLQYSIISTFTALVMLIITVIFVTRGGWYVYNEFFPVKLVKAASYNLLNAFTIYNLYVLSRHVTVKQLYKVVSVCLIILTVYGFVEIAIPYPIPGIHGTIVFADDKRLQLTTAEPVTATILYATFLSVVLYLRTYLKKASKITFLYVLAGLSLLLLIGSKGGVIFLVIAIVLSLRNRINFKIIIGAVLLIIPIIYVIINTIVPMLVVDIEEFTSFSTRATTWLAAIGGLIKYPLGEGYGTYLTYFPPLLIPTCNWLSGVIGISLNTSEMDYYIQVGKYMGAKSGIPNEIMFNGVTTLIYLYIICRYYVIRFKQLPINSANIFFSFLYYFLFLEFLFVVTFETTYYIFIPIVVIDRVLEENNKLIYT